MKGRALNAHSALFVPVHLLSFKSRYRRIDPACSCTALHANRRHRFLEMFHTCKGSCLLLAPSKQCVAYNSPPVLILQYSENFLNKNRYYVEKILF